MEKTVKALDHVINFYMVSRELADLIQAGPHTASTATLIVYLEALDKLAEAQNYFNKNNPQSVELENIEMDQIAKFVEPGKQFAKDSIRLVRRCTKPDRKEFQKIAIATAIGFCIMGFIGFFVKLIHIPINNIIVGS